MEIQTFVGGTLLIFKCGQLTEALFSKTPCGPRKIYRQAGRGPWVTHLHPLLSMFPASLEGESKSYRYHDHQLGLAITPLLTPASKPMNLLMGNKCLIQSPPDSHTKKTGTTNSQPPHPSHQFYFVGKKKKKKRFQREEERKRKTNKGKLESAPLLTWATAAASQRGKQLSSETRPRQENYRAASLTYPCPFCVIHS